MRHRKTIFMLLMLYVVCGLIKYLNYIYGFGAPVGLTIFSQADLQVLIAKPMIYNMFTLLPLMIGITFILKENQGAMQILPYQKKEKLFWQQIRYSCYWSGILAVLCTTAAIVCGVMWNKDFINWMNAQSYFTIIMKQILPEVHFWQVFVMNTIVLFIRNIIFSLFMIVIWWAFSSVIYGILLVTGVCVIEMGMPQIALVLNNVTDDYDFWISIAAKVRFGFVSLGSIALLLLAAKIVMKRKEF